MCTKCVTCATCLNKESCLTCPIGLYLFNNKCLEACPVLFYKDTTANKCSPCDPACE